MTSGFVIQWRTVEGRWYFVGVGSPWSRNLAGATAFRTEREARAMMLRMARIPGGDLRVVSL